MNLLQQPLFTVSQLDGGETSANVVHAFLLHQEDINPLHIQSSFRDLIRQHDVLRACFISSSKQSPNMQILDQSLAESTHLLVLDYSQEPSTERAEKKAIEFITTWGYEPFTLSKAPLVKLVLIKIAHDHFIISIANHHIIADGYSIRLFLIHLLGNYQIYKTRPLPLPKRPFKNKYQEYSNHLDTYLKSTKAQKDLQEWVSKLETTKTITNFLYSYPPSGDNIDFKGASVSLRLTSEESQQFHHYRQTHGISSYLLGFAIFYVLLANLSNETEQIIGTAFSNRQENEWQSVLGLFVNILPIYIPGNASLSFDALLQILKKEVMYAYQRQAIPLTCLLEKLYKNRVLGVSPLFQTVFVETVDIAMNDIHGIKLDPLPIQNRYARYDLTFYLSTDAEGQILLTLEYATKRFDAAMAQAMLTLWHQIFLGILQDDKLPLFEIKLLSHQHYLKKSTIFDIQEMIPFYSVLQMYQEKCQIASTQCALVDGEHRITYSTLDALANQIAHLIQTKLISTQHVVAIYMEKSWRRVATIIAVLKLNHIFLMLDASQGDLRIQSMLEQSNTSLILIEKENNEPWLNGAIDTLTIPSENLSINTLKPPPINYSISPNDIAFIIFTSGSTGKPKGVCVLHRGLINRIQWMHETYPFRADEKAAHMSSGIFVDAIAEIFVPLLAGIPAVIIPESLKLELNRLCDYLTEHRVTRILMIPSLLSYLITVCKQRKDNLDSCWLFSTSGEPLLPSVCDQFFAHFRNKTLLNIYGSSEVTADASAFAMKAPPTINLVPIGKAIRNTGMVVLNPGNQVLPPGLPGQIGVYGDCVSGGYIQTSSQEQLRFIPWEDSTSSKRTLFLTGDYGMLLPSGDMAYLGRYDSQIKIRGMRVDTKEIENTLLQDPSIHHAIVSVHPEDQHELIAYYSTHSMQPLNESKLRDDLFKRLSNYMVPSQFFYLKTFPRLPTGKIDRLQLKMNTSQTVKTKHEASNLYQNVFDLYSILFPNHLLKANDHFFEIGGHSLKLIELRQLIQERLGKEVSTTDLFRYHSIAKLTEFLEREGKEKNLYKSDLSEPGPLHTDIQEDIAVIGYAGRFPGASCVEDLWQLLQAEICSLKDLTEEELTAEAILLKKTFPTGFIGRAGSIPGIETIDTHLFKLNAQEATFLDPQHRIFLECCWEAMEHAAIIPSKDYSIGIYAGCSPSTYLLSALWQDISIKDPAKLFSILSSNGENYLATRMAYHLDLTGPALSIQTACSSSLVAIDTAIRALRGHQCTMALAGGVTIKVPQDIGYIYQEGGIVSKDGYCKPFAQEASGTVFSNGAGVLLLKRKTDALRDGDQIHAILRGSAVNNDGRDKAGFVAPSVEGQMRVIQQALLDARLKCDDIDYLETHGTGTYLGDHVELTALHTIFSKGSSATKPLWLGSIKSNIGHLDAAAGVAGVLKVISSLKNQCIPPTLFSSTPMSHFDWENSSLKLVNSCLNWPKRGQLARAGVSSFGIGGTNAHLILEESPKLGIKSPTYLDQYEIIALSAASETALYQRIVQLKQYLQTHPHTSIADVAHTLQIGRQPLDYRIAWVCRPVLEEVIQVLSQAQQSDIVIDQRRIAFLYEGNYVPDHHYHAVAERYPIYMEKIQQLSNLLKEQYDIDIMSNLLNPLSEIVHSDLLTFIVFAAQSALLKHVGIIPLHAQGSGVGRWNAWCEQGLLTEEEALANIYMGNDVFFSTTSLDVDLEFQWISVLPQHEIELDPVFSVLARLANLWVKGCELEWSKIVRHSGVKKIALPTYPFDRKYYWIKPKVLIDDIHEFPVPSIPCSISNRPKHIQAEYHPPSSEIEHQLCRIWEKYLSIASIGLDDHFFELGGDSIIMLQILAEITSLYSITIKSSHFFQSPTIRALAEQLKTQQDNTELCNELLL